MTLHEADKAVQRYSVPDVLEPNLETLQAAWESIVPEGRSGPTRLTMGTTVVLVQHSPFALTMTVNGAEVLAFNDRQLLHMEHQHTTRQVSLSCLLSTLFSAAGRGRGGGAARSITATSCWGE